MTIQKVRVVMTIIRNFFNKLINLIVICRNLLQLWWSLSI